MVRPDLARRYAELIKQEDVELQIFMYQGNPSPQAIVLEYEMVEKRKRYHWQGVVKDAANYFVDDSQPIAERLVELESLMLVYPEMKDSVSTNFSRLHRQVMSLLHDGKESEAKALAEKELIPLAVNLLLK